VEAKPHKRRGIHDAAAKEKKTTAGGFFLLRIKDKGKEEEGQSPHWLGKRRKTLRKKNEPKTTKKATGKTEQCCLG